MIFFLSSCSDARPSANPDPNPSPNPEPFIPRSLITNLFRRFAGKGKSAHRQRQESQRPPRQLGASNSYGGPTLPTYGGSRAPAPVQNIGSAPGPSLGVYGPQLPTGGSAPAGNNYGAAAPTSGGSIDSYGSPSAPPVGGGGNVDSYGSPSAPPVNGGGNQDSYGSPSAPQIGVASVGGYVGAGGNSQNTIVPAPVPVPAPSSAGGSYGSPSAPPVAPAPQPNCDVTRSLVNTGNCQQGGQVK